jgi:3',5'-cyclic-AMP phosphodiesterase
MSCAMSRAMSLQVLPIAAALSIALTACILPADERATAELAIGRAAAADSSVRIEGGLAAVRDLADARLELWSQAPVVDIELDVGSTAGATWTIVIRNALSDSLLTAEGITYVRDPDLPPTVAVFHVPLVPGLHVLRVAPPDADTFEPFRVAAMADIQTALPEVDDVFAQINAVPGARFVVSMGDITQRSEVWEYDLFDQQLTTLQIPYYTTLGNHELWADPSRYFDRYGRASFSFTFKGVTFTFADSGDGGIDPLVETWLVDWLGAARDHTSIFLTHFPPIDPVGGRYGGFRSADDGRRLLSRFVENNVDLTLYGHIHTYIEFENAGIPAYISGGGGAEPVKWDGIDRHFLVIDADAAGVRNVAVHRVD